jgi:hypothetical protein
MIGNRRASPLLRVWVPRFAGALARGIFDGILSSVVEFWDEESLGSLDSGGPALEHSGSAVCLARSFVRQWEPCSAWFSCSVVVLGPSHTSYLVGQMRGFHSKRTSWESEFLRICSRAWFLPSSTSTCSWRCARFWAWAHGACWRMYCSCEGVPPRPLVELGGLLGHLWRDPDFPILRTLSR